jgi:hypothetical protein
VSKRSELALCAYTLAVVLMAFVQATHEAGWDVPTTEILPATPTMIAMIALNDSNSDFTLERSSYDLY